MAAHDPFGVEPAPMVPMAPRAPQLPGRHALGLPGGSVRALLALMVLGLVWALMFLQKEIPTTLQYLMFLILGHYFAAHSRSISADIREPAPLYMPRGVIRLFIFLGFIAVLGAIYYHNRDDLDKLVNELKSDKERKKYLPMLMVTGFFLGLFATKIGQMFGSKEGSPPWFQDIQAWLSLLAMLGLATFVIINYIVNPSIEDEENRIKLSTELEAILAAVVGFYFGARS